MAGEPFDGVARCEGTPCMCRVVAGCAAADAGTAAITAALASPTSVPMCVIIDIFRSLSVLQSREEPLEFWFIDPIQRCRLDNQSIPVDEIRHQWRDLP